ncbi:purine-nucleoside phosphorylase [Marinihelvus fidelis]|uniref:Purine nucleoside phosphorylase DeoD-type n=1 Tax=Marinihelvus fidelis TaxID=2613842 RepID=A0A5N0TAS3_9GAMM|nr:purine-nucleoside phosphorylase [Marinihelvus fidelis]KAA9131861.1 purine-nucleoside phosphorylase [Marinihelvus fidelis]
MSTPHIDASPGDFAELVLMPGDPLRAQALATQVLEGAKQVNGVRNMLAFTGRYQGHEVSIMGSGMGMPSISIYAHELYDHFGVQRIVRVGTCGALTTDLQLGDLVLATAASTDSAMNRERFSGWDYAPAADFAMARAAYDAAVSAGLAVTAGEVMSTDWFYHPDTEFVDRVAAAGVLALDMETAALYALARQHQRRALTLLTVSDVIPAGAHFTPAERQSAFGAVIDAILPALVNEA